MLTLDWNREFSLRLVNLQLLRCLPLDHPGQGLHAAAVSSVLLLLRT